MLYTVKLSNGVSIECDSAEAAIDLARKVGGDFVEIGRTGKTTTHDGASGTTSRWTEQRVRDFFATIKAQQRKLVEALLDNPDGRTSEQLCQHLGLANGAALAGVFTGLWKNAKKVGANPKDLYARQSVTLADKRQYEYTLADSFRSAAKKYR